MALQSAFYIIGIVFMSLMLLLILALVAAVFVIRAKINRIHDEIVAKLRIVDTVAGFSSGMLGKTSVILGAARKILQKHQSRHR